MLHMQGGSLQLAKLPYFGLLFTGLAVYSDHTWLFSCSLLPRFSVSADSSVAATPVKSTAAAPTFHATPLTTKSEVGLDVGPVASPIGGPVSPVGKIATTATRVTTTIQGLQTQTKRLPRISLWFGSREQGQRYLYMMQAFWSTLIGGFSVARDRGTWQLDSQITERRTLPSAIERAGLQKCDVFVWVGYEDVMFKNINWQFFEE